MADYYTCTAPRPDAFGGGCCAVFLDRIEILNTAQMLHGLLGSPQK